MRPAPRRTRRTSADGSQLPADRSVAAAAKPSRPTLAASSKQTSQPPGSGPGQTRRSRSRS